MKIHRICVTSRLDPFWFNRFRSGSHGAVVEADGALTLDGVDLRITEEPPAAGTPVSVWVSGSGHLVCATLADIEHEAQAKRDAEAAQAQRLRRQRNDLRDQALSFNAQFALPVKWNAGVKDVLHGLSSRSWGDGRNSATVAHAEATNAVRASVK